MDVVKKLMVPQLELTESILEKPYTYSSIFITNFKFPHEDPVSQNIESLAADRQTKDNYNTWFCGANPRRGPIAVSLYRDFLKMQVVWILVMEPNGTSGENRDFIELFVDCGVPEIAAHILSFLDYENLKAAEIVCSLWRDVIRHGNIWKRCLNTMLRNPTLKKLYQRAPQWMNVQPEEPNFFKSACYTIVHYKQRLLYNWMTGSQQEEWAPSINITEETICLDMNSRYLVVTQQNGRIHIENREESAEPKIKELQLRPGIHCAQLNEQNILICGGLEGVIQICGVHLGKLLHRFTVNETDKIEHLRFKNGLLIITGSTMQEKYKSRLSSWNIAKLPLISRREEILFHTEKIYGLGFDEKCTTILTGENSKFEVQIRQTHNLQNIIHYMRYTSRTYSGFHYENEFVAAGSDDGKIRIWSAVTGTCIRILLRPSYDTGSIWFRFNHKFLVTNNSHGISIWNFKEAVNSNLDPYLKLFYCSIKTRSSSQSNQWNFLMDDFEIIRFEHPPIIGPLPGGHRGKSHVVRHQFLSPWFY